MNIFTSFDKILDRYGCDAVVINGDVGVKTKAFVSPLYYDRTQSHDRIRHRLGVRKTNSFLFIAPPDTVLETGVTVIESEKGKYTVKRHETYYVKDNPLYVRAVLCACNESEGDYESS